jgi:hypothetical protein
MPSRRGGASRRAGSVRQVAHPSAAVDPSRRSRLLALKLAALVRDHTGGGELVPGVFPGGAALVREGDEAWVLVEERPERGLGPALAWARQQGASRVHVIGEQGTGVLARRATAFATPPAVWLADGRQLVPAPVEPPSVPAPVEPELLELAALIEAGGATPVIEHGVLVGEVVGLEVCRAIRDAALGTVRLEVGVGRHDREAFQLMHGDVPTVVALARVVEAVARHRRPGADPHPLNRLGAERALRARLLAEPGLVGLVELAATDPPVPRRNLKDPVPCVAVGRDAAGSPTVVVCSVGIDLDLVPFAADARLARRGSDDAGLVLALAARDAHPVTGALAAALRRPAQIVTVETA